MCSTVAGGGWLKTCGAEPSEKVTVYTVPTGLFSVLVMGNDKEVAEQLGIDLQTLWRWQADTENAVHVPLEHTTTDADSNTQNIIEPLINEAEGAVDDEISRQQEYEILRNSLGSLKEQERIVLTLYYFEDLKLHEIADVLELTESRVSQIRAKALGKLRVELAGFRQRVA